MGFIGAFPYFTDYMLPLGENNFSIYSVYSTFAAAIFY